MEFESWKAAAAALLADQYGIDPAEIAETVWRRLYVTNHAPREAANVAADIYRKGHSGPKRRRG
jgi:hypothetical protein